MEKDANTETSEIDVQPDSSPAIETEPIDSGSEFKPTTGLSEVDDTDEGLDTSDSAEQNTDDTPGTQDFDKHPRFKEVINQKNEYKDKFDNVSTEFNQFKDTTTQEINNLKNLLLQNRQPTNQTPKKSKYKHDLTTMDSDTIYESFADDSRGVFNDLGNMILKQADVLFDQKMKLHSQAQQKEAEQNTVEGRITEAGKYFEENPDAAESLVDGSYEQFLNNNPQLDRTFLIKNFEIFKSMQGSGDFDQKVQEGIDAGVKEALEKHGMNLKAGGDLAPVGKGVIKPKGKSKKSKRGGSSIDSEMANAFDAA